MESNLKKSTAEFCSLSDGYLSFLHIIIQHRFRILYLFEDRGKSKTREDFTISLLRKFLSKLLKNMFIKRKHWKIKF